MPHIDELWNLRHRPDIPAAERADANAELMSQIFDLVKSSDMLPDHEEVSTDLVPSLLKASTIYPAFEQYAIGERNKGPGHSAILYLNEYGIVDTGRGNSRYLEKGWMGGFDFLRDVVNNTDFLAAIIRTDVNQVLRFLRPYEQDDDAPYGFHWVRTDGEKLTKVDKRRTDELTQWLLNSGEEPDPLRRDRKRLRGLKQFVTQLLWNTLSADAAPIELERTWGGTIYGYRNLDYTTIRLTSESGYEGDDEVRAVQIYQNVPAVAFTYNDLLYEIRNPSTDIRSGGYGIAETENFIRAVTAYLNACMYNASGIDRSAVPRGLLLLYGKFDVPQLTAAKREMHTMLSGAANRHKVVMLNSETKEGGAQWVPIDTYNEMAFARLVTLCISLGCAMFGKHPDEINCDSFSMRTSALGGKGDTIEKLAHAYEKGAASRLDFVGDTLNKLAGIQQTAKWGRVLYRLVWAGLRPENEEWEKERAKLTKTNNELRAMDGAEPCDDPVMGGAPVGNPAAMSLYTQRVMQQAAREQQQVGGGQPGGKPAPGQEETQAAQNGTEPGQFEEQPGQAPAVAKAAPRGVRWLGDFAVIEG